MADNVPSEKGKGKALDQRLNHVQESSQAETSLAKKIVSSASGLLKDTVGSSNGHVPSLIASSTSLGSKVQSSGPSSRSTGWTETGTTRSTSGTDAGQQDSAHSESFRTRQSQSSTAGEFEQFVSKPTLSFDLSAQLDQSHIQSSRAEESRFEQDSAQKSKSNLKNTGEQYSQASAEIDDGAEVRHLLSDPAFDSAFRVEYNDIEANEHASMYQELSHAIQLDDGAEVRNLLSEPSVDSVFNNSLNEFSTTECSDIATDTPAYSELERAIVTALRSDLPPPPIHKDVPNAHPLNLRPLSDTEKDSLPQRIRDYEIGLSSRGQSLATLPAEDERDGWLSDWQDVLNGYSDQVWGDMLPVVKAAKGELEDVQNGSASLDSKTVARLKMILGHIHGHPGAQPPIQ